MGRRRVLLEYPASGTPWVVAQALERVGYEALICEGPGEAAGVCRMLTDGECSLVDDADVVYNAFGLESEGHRAIISELRRRYPDTPVVVEGTRTSLRRQASLVDDCTPSEAPVTVRSMTVSIATALAGVLTKQRAVSDGFT